MANRKSNSICRYRKRGALPTFTIKPFFLFWRNKINNKGILII